MSQRVLGMTMLAALVGTALHAEPTIRRVSVRGLQIGASTTIVVEGSELSGASARLLGAPIKEQVAKSGGQADRREFVVTIDPKAAVGIYQLRLATDQGVSNPVTIGVDTLPQRAFGEEIKALPVSLSGSLEGNQILKVKVAGKRGDRLVVEVESRRLGANLRPVIRLLDPTGRQIAWSPARVSIYGDARCQANLPVDGDYTVQLHDLLYRGASPGFFRLKIGDLHYGDLAFPLGLSKDQPRDTTVVSTSLKPEARLRIATDTLGERPAALPSAPQLSGGRPRVIVSAHPEVLEGASKPDPALPVALNGRISEPSEEDQFSLSVIPGAKLRFDVMARRFGSDLDGVLILRGEKGNELGRNDDRPGSPDPQLDYTVPANVSKLVVALRDLQGRGGERFIYRIAVRDLSAPDFRLVVESDRINVPEGGARVVRLRAERSNYDGPINLQIDGLTEGIEVTGARIASGANLGLLTFRAPKGVSGNGLIRIIGTGNASKPLVRVANSDVTASNRYQPWLRNDVALAVAPAIPISVHWVDAKPQDKLFLGASFPARIQLRRLEGTKGKVRLKLLTTQSPIKKKIKKDNKQVEVDDIDRMLRLSDTPVIDEAMTELTVNVLAPGDLPNRDWGLVLVAELLSTDGKQVLAATSTTSRFFATESPVGLQLSGDGKVEAKAGKGQTGTLHGSIRRATGWSNPVTVTLTSLPSGYPSPQVVVPADKNEFALPVRFPYGTKAGELEAKLQATYLADPKKPKQVVRSNALAVTLRITPGEKPTAETPLTVFEDDAAFLELLSDGGGTIRLDPNEKHSGAASAKVTPDQRFNAAIAFLGVKIREKPGPGEYRYLRFAWKKKGGQSICLQINHDGTWGPGGDARKGAKFRYHAGSGAECFGASVKLSDRIPDKFVVVTRDLFADFGEFIFSGIALSPLDGEYGLFDHVYLARSPADFERLKKSPEKTQ